MRTDTAPTISRHDYQPYPWRIPAVSLRFDLDPHVTRVHSALDVQRAGDGRAPLVLNGQDLELESVVVDGARLADTHYRVQDDVLSIDLPGDRHVVEIVSTCRPQDNTSLMGLYVSGDKLFTQCEAEGFRRITWFADRPDVMSRYRVTLSADKQRYPLLLSNGNLLQQRDTGGGRHEALWEDPHPKPSYLFALVAGDFDCRQRAVETNSGRPATLQVYSDRGSHDKTAWALDCLERAMKWDERRFGLELDLDRFMIVAARDFNMGAMENKGLNVFNSAYVLADPDTTTDASYRAVEAVIGHEYFHNWTGNRVTCRDWFQLSLKEGLTVFRDQEFSADMMAEGLTGAEADSARAVKRIDDVSTLRIAQFPEDAGPMAHPIRPESYQEIGNFYTATVYEKGAEVIRMQHTLLGEEGFRAGLDEYFRRHDGSAVTCDDFVAAMESVYERLHPGKDMHVFRRWYSQAGTPRVKVQLDYDAATKVCRVTLGQRCDVVGVEKLATPPVQKLPLHIPFAMGLIDRDGQPIPIPAQGQAQDTVLLELTETSQTWEFPGIDREPVPSLLRNFSAPVIVEYDRPDADLMLLACNDSDPFARWEAGQELASRHLLAAVRAFQAGAPLPDCDTLQDTWRALLEDPSLSPAYRARVLALPSDKELVEKTDPMDPAAASLARRDLHRQLGAGLAELWLETYRSLAKDTGPYSPDALAACRRALKNLALHYLMSGGHPEAEALALTQYREARNMTDRLGGLSALVHYAETDRAVEALRSFYEQWQQDPLVVDRWFALQATAPSTTVDTVRALMLHPAFSLRNPNRARSLIFQFCMNNLRGAHQPDGYAFWSEQVLALDALNPEIAARLARAFDNWARYVPANRNAMRQAYERIQSEPRLSRNVSEIVSKALTI